jgi:hypothetical protein
LGDCCNRGRCVAVDRSGVTNCRDRNVQFAAIALCGERFVSRGAGKANGEGNAFLERTLRADQAEQDLSPRIMDAIKESPTTALTILFRQIGLWLKGAAGGE